MIISVADLAGEELFVGLVVHEVVFKRVFPNEAFTAAVKKESIQNFKKIGFKNLILILLVKKFKKTLTDHIPVAFHSPADESADESRETLASTQHSRRIYT